MRSKALNSSSGNIVAFGMFRRNSRISCKSRDWRILSAQASLVDIIRKREWEREKKRKRVLWWISMMARATLCKKGRPGRECVLKTSQQKWINKIKYQGGVKRPKLEEPRPMARWWWRQSCTTWQRRWRAPHCLPPEMKTSEKEEKKKRKKKKKERKKAKQERSRGVHAREDNTSEAQQ